MKAIAQGVIAYIPGKGREHYGIFIPIIDGLDYAGNGRRRSIFRGSGSRL